MQPAYLVRFQVETIVLECAVQVVADNVFELPELATNYTNKHEYSSANLFVEIRAIRGYKFGHQ